MSEPSTTNLRVESLKASHLPKLKNILQPNRFLWLQRLLIRSWIATAENNLPGLLPAIHPLCIVTSEQDNVIAYSVIHPYNRRGSCWLITSPEIVSDPKNTTLRVVKQSLMQHALQLGSQRAQSWVFKCKASEVKDLSLARELGFQPLKLQKCWNLPEKNKVGNNNYLHKRWPEELNWEKLNKKTAPLLWPLEQAGYSSHLRQIFDRQWIDLLNQNQSNTGVLVNSEKRRNAIAGIIEDPSTDNVTGLQLIRELAWDCRLSDTIPKILCDLSRSSYPFLLKTASDDEQLNKLLEDYGFKISFEEILLGRSIWRRQINNKLIPGANQLESMLDRLKPQTPPLPTPSLGRR